jgi:hypothetical protein
MCLIGLVDARLCGRIEVHAHRSFVIGMDRHALQTQFPPSAIELRNCPKLHFTSSHSVSTMAAATNPSATPINGLKTANQKEMFQSELLVGFVFMLFFSSIRRSTFHKNVKLPSGCLERGTRETVPRHGGIFPLLGDDFRPSGPPPDGLAVVSSDSTSCDHGLAFITIQCPLSSGGTAFRGNGDAKRASALAAAATNSVATIAFVFINEFLTRFGKLYR